MFTTVWGIAFALSAIMWLPTLELFFQTLFRGGSLNSSGVYAGYTIPQRLLSLPLLSNFLMPGVFGSPEIYNIKKFAGVDYNDFNGAIGFLPGLFAFWGCAMLWKRKTIRPFIVLIILSLLLPILTPLYSFLYHRFFIIASLSLCVVGAVSLQSFLQNERIRISFTRLFKWTKVAFGVMVVSLIGIWIYIAINHQSLYSEFAKLLSSKVAQSNFGVGNESWMFGRLEKTLLYYSSFSYDLWLPIIASLIVLVTLTYYLKGKLSDKNFLVVVFLTSAAQLFIYARSWYPSIDPAQFPIFPNNPISSYLQRDTTGARFIVWRDATKDPYILTRNSSNVYKTFDIHGYESCTNRAMMVFYLQNVPGDSLDLRLLGLVNVKYIITGKKALSSPDLRWLYSADSVTIYENLLCKPRAYFAHKTIITGSDSATAKQLLRQDFDGRTSKTFGLL